MGQAGQRDKMRAGARRVREAAGRLWAAVWAAEARRAVLWLPVCLGAGAWAYFALTSEPHPAWAALPLPFLALLVSGAAWRAGWLALALAAGGMAATTGFSAAILHARAVAAPVLATPVTETVEGRVIALDRSQSGAPRATLDRVIVYGLETARTPARIRISLVEEGAAPPAVGHRIRVRARLHPPPAPAEPGAYDFRRAAYFARLGAVGFVRGAAVLDLGPAEVAGPLDRAALWLAERRSATADALRAALPGPEGAFAAAIVVGDRSTIAESDAEALRAANLAHLLAISGLHMGMLCGLVFFATRLGLAAVPALALALPAKKLAAAAALAAGAAYLALSGATVATQRAFVMVAVALVAVMIDRPAVSLRALAVAAVLVILWRPLSVMEVGFRMSFAATLALVAGYEALAGRLRAPGGGTPSRRLAGGLGVWVAALVFTSVVAGLATAPYAAAAFNRAAPWGLPANLAAVPAMGLGIAPMAVIAGLAAPFGLETWPLRAMGLGISWVLAVAHEVASWPGAVRPVPVPPPGALALVTLGGLWLALWRGGLRLVGAVAVAGGLWSWAEPLPRPAVLIAPGAGLVGVMGPEGRALDHPRRSGFAAGLWLRRDGDLATQEAAAARPPGGRSGRDWEAAIGGGWRLVLRGGRVEPAELAGLCGRGVLLVAPRGPSAVPGACRYLGGRALERMGAVAVYLAPGGGLRIETAAEAAGRPWTPG